MTDYHTILSDPIMPCIPDQSEHKSATLPQSDNPIVSGRCGVTNIGTGRANAIPVPMARIFREFNSGLDSLEIAELFGIPEAHVWNIFARGDAA